MTKLRTIIISHYKDKLTKKQIKLQKEVVQHEVKTFNRADMTSNIVVVNSNGLSKKHLLYCDVLETGDSFYDKLLAVYDTFKHNRVGIVFADLPYLRRSDINRYLYQTIGNEEDLILQFTPHPIIPKISVSTGYFNIINMRSLPDYTRDLLLFLKSTENENWRTIFKGLESNFPNVHKHSYSIIKDYLREELYDGVFEQALNNLGIEAVVKIADTNRFSIAVNTADKLEKAYHKYVEITSRIENIMRKK